MESMQGYTFGFMGSDVQIVISHYRGDGRITEEDALFLKRVEECLDDLILAADFFKNLQSEIGISFEQKISDFVFVLEAIQGNEKTLGISTNYHSDLIPYFQSILKVIKELQTSSPEVSDEETEKAYIFFGTLAKYALSSIQSAQMSMAASNDM